MSYGLTRRQEACVPKVVFQLIPIRELVSNQDYQRPLSESHILKAVNDFDVCQINPVKVSRRDGVNYVFDGQHTIEIVAAKSGSRETPVWCMIYDDLAYREEAHIFAEQQKNKKNLVPYEVFNAHVEAGEQKYLMIRDLVSSYGLKVSGDKTLPTNICAVSALESVFDGYGYHVLDQTIRLILATWEGERGSFTGSMIKGMAKIIVTYGNELQEEEFKAKVGCYSIRTVIRRGREICAGSLGIATAMVNIYNEKRKRYLLQADRLYGSGKGKRIREEILEEDRPEAEDDGGDWDLSEDPDEI